MKIKTGAGILSVFLVFSVFLSACSLGTKNSSSCAPPPAPQKTQSELFDEFLEQEFVDYVTSGTFIMHQLLQNPEDFGIAEYAATWGDIGYPSEEELEKDRRVIQEFRSFDRAVLAPEQQQSYDIVAYQCELYEASLELYYYDDPFHGSSGYHAILPVMLSEYEFTRERDVEDYLTLLEQTGTLVDGLLQFEKDKSTKGLFMSDRLADLVIEGCEGFLKKTDDNMLVTSFQSRLEAADFIDASKKEALTARNLEAFNNTLIPAYHRIITEFKALKGTGKNSGGLAGFEKGRDYYIQELKQLGTSKSPEEWIKLCDDGIQSVLDEIKTIGNADPDAVAGLESDIVPDLTVEETVRFWKEKTAADFPTLPQDVTYQIKPIDDSLKDSLAPAFYFVPKLDNYTANVIYYNADYAKTSPEYLFFTLAHEAYPGHLLQKVGLRASSLSNYRKVVSFNGYTEGWANYVQLYCYQYIDAADNVKRLKQLEQEFSYLSRMRWDLGVNYEGWDLAQFTEYMKSCYPGAAGYTAETFEYYYHYVIENALQIAPYVLGQLEITKLKKHYQSAMGSAYSDKRFHEELLKYGEAPFSILKGWMDEALLPEPEEASTQAAA